MKKLLKTLAVTSLLLATTTIANAQQTTYQGNYYSGSQPIQQSQQQQNYQSYQQQNYPPQQQSLNTVQPTSTLFQVRNKIDEANGVTNSVVNGLYILKGLTRY